MAGACSGVMPAHGASSSHDSRSPTTASAPTPPRTAAITSRAKRSAVGAPLVVALVREPGQELADQAVLAGVDLDAVAAGVDGEPAPRRRTRRRRRRCRRPPSTSAPRGVLTSGTRDGAHSGALAVGRRALPAGVVERGDDERAVRRGRRRRSPAQPSAAPLGQRRPLVRPVATSCTLAPSTTIVPHPPRARRS